MAYLYKHIRLDTNEVFYIGISNQIKKYRKNSKERNIFWRNITSKTDYKIEIIISNISLETAKELEIEYIKIYGRRDLGLGTLVNLTDGGDGVNNLSKESIENSRIKRLAQNRKCTLELKEANRIRHLGNTYRKGKLYSEESKLKYIESRKKLILNLETGIYYKGVVEAAESINKNQNYLGKRLINLLKNNTPFIYI